MILPSQILTEQVGAVNQPVFRRNDALITLDEYRHDVACLVAALKHSAARRAVLYTEDNYDFAVGLLACLHAGLHMILPGNLCENTYRRLKADSDVFVHELQPGKNAAALEQVDPAGITVEFYTSGSTGEPKRIIRTFANLEAELNMLRVPFPETSQPVEVFPTVSFHHAYGIIFGLLLPLSRGYISDTTRFSGLESWLSRINHYARSGILAWAVVTPAFLRIWAENAELCCISHRPIRILSAGAPLPEITARQIAAATEAQIFEIFGSSETGVVAHRRPLENKAWKPFAEVGIELDAESGIRVYSPAVPQGTYARLGDMVEFLPDNTFMLKPRVDRIVKLADKRISLTEIETCLQECDLVNQAYALVVPAQPIDRLAVAVVPSEKGFQILKERGYVDVKKELRRVLNRQVEKTLLPRKWRLVGELPCNAQGKVQHAAVADLFAGHLQLPLMHPVTKSADELVFRLLYVKDSAYLEGHFPGYPIVPGVVILESLTQLVQRYWQRQVCGIVRLKFSAETLPGDIQTVHMKRKGDDVSVEILLEDGRKACQGRLMTEPCLRDVPRYSI